MTRAEYVMHAKYSLLVIHSFLIALKTLIAMLDIIKKTCLLYLVKLY